MKLFKKVLIGITGSIIVLVGGFAIWGYSGGRPMLEAIRSLNSDEKVTVETGKWLVFTPVDEEAIVGFVFYPGGRVDYRAYAPYVRALAEEGVLVIIPSMPLNFAVFGVNQAEEVMQAYPDISEWVIGGHSLGGAMAANFLSNHQDELEGLILLAAYPSTADDLSMFDGKVISISGSLDGLATPEKIQASRSLLPPSTTWVEIQGGNHAQFGWYGPQKGDYDALISREEQQQIILHASTQFVSDLMDR